MSFEAFLELAAVSLYDCERDRHWKSIQTYCTVCNLEYDFILKQETAMAENDFLIEVMGYGDTKPLLHIPGKYKTDRNQVIFSTLVYCFILTRFVYLQVENRSSSLHFTPL